MPRTDDKEAYVVIGLRIRLCRILHGMERGELAGAVGISLYKLRRYEAAESKIHASTLEDIAREFGVTSGYFFEGIDIEDHRR